MNRVNQARLRVEERVALKRFKVPNGIKVSCLRESKLVLIWTEIVAGGRLNRDCHEVPSSDGKPVTVEGECIDIGGLEGLRRVWLYVPLVAYPSVGSVKSCNAART